MQDYRVSPLSPYYRAVKELYYTSFPANERLPWLWLVTLALLRQADFFAYCQGGEFIGFSYSLKHRQLYYLLFLAVAEAQHSKGYGRNLLTAVSGRANGRPVFLAIEPLDQEADNYPQRIRRLSFYEKNGYYLTDYFYYENKEAYQIMANQVESQPALLEALSKWFFMSGVRIRLEKIKK